MLLNNLYKYILQTIYHINGFFSLLKFSGVFKFRFINDPNSFWLIIENYNEIKQYQEVSGLSDEYLFGVGVFKQVIRNDKGVWVETENYTDIKTHNKNYPNKPFYLVEDL